MFSGSHSTQLIVCVRLWHNKQHIGILAANDIEEASICIAQVVFNKTHIYIYVAHATLAKLDGASIANAAHL